MSAALILFKQVSRGGANALPLRLHFPPALTAESFHRACGGRTGPDRTGSPCVWCVSGPAAARSERRFGHDSSREAKLSGGADLPECGSADGRYGWRGPGARVQRPASVVGNSRPWKQVLGWLSFIPSYFSLLISLLLNAGSDCCGKVNGQLVKNKNLFTVFGLWRKTGCRCQVIYLKRTSVRNENSPENSILVK